MIGEEARERAFAIIGPYVALRKGKNIGEVDENDVIPLHPGDHQWEKNLLADLEDEGFPSDLLMGAFSQETTIGEVIEILLS